jgi:hypothetical protein
LRVAAMGESTARFCACQGSPCNAPAGLNETINLYDRATTYRVVPGATECYPFPSSGAPLRLIAQPFVPSATIWLGPFLVRGFGHSRQLRAPIAFCGRFRLGGLDHPRVHSPPPAPSAPPLAPPYQRSGGQCAGPVGLGGPSPLISPRLPGPLDRLLLLARAEPSQVRQGDREAAVRRAHEAASGVREAALRGEAGRRGPAADRWPGANRAAERGRTTRGRTARRAGAAGRLVTRGTRPGYTGRVRRTSRR